MELFNHQRAGIEHIKKNNGIGALYFDVGTGKTLTALKIYEHYKAQQPSLQLLVVCPISIIEGAWIEDIVKFTEFSYSNLRKDTDISKDILLINYEMIIAQKSRALMMSVLDKRPMCVVDESQKIKGYSAKITKTMLSVAPLFPYKVVMSATPAPNGEHEYWSQMTFLNPTLLGKNFFVFRNYYFCLARGKSYLPIVGLNSREIMMMMQKGFKMKISPLRKSMFIDKIKPLCLFVNKKDVLDLPQEVNQVRFIPMTPEQAKAYKEMWDNLVTEINGETINVTLALAKIMKCRQITSGFMYGEEGKAVEFKINKKFNELKEVINEIGEKKVIVFCQYKYEIKKIAEAYGQRAVTLYGDTEDKDKAIRDFKESDSGILVAHPASAGVGLSFNDCDYMIFYSLDYSYMNYYQSRGRIMRAGKKNKATFIHLLCEKSIDMVIYKALNNKEDNDKLFRRLMNG